jgi:molybdopterin-guanine dinucleotide biosynthesis protein A
MRIWYKHGILESSPWRKYKFWGFAMMVGHESGKGRDNEKHASMNQNKELANLDRDGRSFVNINTPEEFEKIKTGGSS